MTWLEFWVVVGVLLACVFFGLCGFSCGMTS